MITPIYHANGSQENMPETAWFEMRKRWVRANRKAMIASIIVWCGVILGVIGFWIGIAAVAYHFIHKLW